MPEGPARRRSNSSSNMGGPGALASRTRDGAELTDQRVSPVLGTGSASSRSSNKITPDCSAANVSRRLAVRSSSGHLPQHSTIIAWRPGQRAASAALRSNALGSGACPNTSAPGSPPSSTRPGACSPPPRRPASSERSHRIGDPRFDARSASIAANPAALGPSSASAGNNSCTRPRANPPCNVPSSPLCPVAIRPLTGSRSLLAIKASFRLIMAS
jgi:hypothetical protein